MPRPSFTSLEQLDADTLQLVLLDTVELLTRDWGRTPKELSELAFDFAWKLYTEQELA